MAGTPQATWDAAGYVRLPVNFKGTRHARVNWDVRTKVDLRGSRGIQFDFYCRELEPFTSFSVYFRSGDGWYHASFCPDRAGVWQRIEIDKADTRVEGKPAGWGQVDAIRVSGWRGRDLDTLCAMANLGFAGGTPQVLVVRADSNVAGSGGEGKSFSRYAWTVSSTFDRLGIDSVQVADTDLAPDLFEGIKLVVLPYNPRIPATAVEHLRAYVAGGGKLLVCYSLPAEIGKLQGCVRRVAWWRSRRILWVSRAPCRDCRRNLTSLSRHRGAPRWPPRWRGSRRACWRSGATVRGTIRRIRR